MYKNLFQARRRCTRFFLMEAEDLVHSELRRIDEETNRFLKCDDYHVVYVNTQPEHHVIDPEEEYHFSVYICDWSNSITIKMKHIKAESRFWEAPKNVVKETTIKHPVTPSKIKNAYLKQIQRAKIYFGHDI